MITRNRVDSLRETLHSVSQSSFPVTQTFVSDDSTNDFTQQMLAEEFPDAVWLRGPLKGRSANRNNGIAAARCDYILVSDDDMLIHKDFVATALSEAEVTQAGLFFSPTLENGRRLVPNALDYLGFATKPYSEGTREIIAIQQCFIISRAVAQSVTFDELITQYGYEEWDYAYRVASAGFSIRFLPGCDNIHTDPQVSGALRHELDAGRLYVTYKRYAYVEKRPMKALLFVCVAASHHMLAMVKRYGLNGLRKAFRNFAGAWNLLQMYRHKLR